MTITLEYKGVELDIDYSYEAGEERIYYDANGGNPGSSESCSINEIELNGVDVSELLEDQVEELESIILEKR